MWSFNRLLIASIASHRDLMLDKQVLGTNSHLGIVRGSLMPQMDCSPREQLHLQSTDLWC